MPRIIRFDLENAAWILSLYCLVYCLIVNRRQYKFSKSVKANLLNQHVVFILAVFSLTVTSASSVAGSFLETLSSRQVFFWQYLLHTLYYLFHITLSICLALYFMDITGAGVGKKEKYFILFSLPYLLVVLLILTNPLSDVCFYMDARHVYHRGAWMPLLYACGLAYLVMCFLLFFRHIRAISRTDRMEVGALLFLAAVGVVLQALYPQLRVELFAEALTLLGIMMIMEERSGHVDSLTGALNRPALIDASRRLIESGRSSRLILVKLTNLDLFAKLFSSREIDSLILQVAEWLTEAAAEYELFHYRDRDFAILVPDEGNSLADDLGSAILQRFEQDWQTGAVNFRLEAELCIVRIPEDISSLNDLDELIAIRFREKNQGTRLVTFHELSTFRRNRHLAQSLRDAVAGQKLRVWYQPIWSVEEGRTVAAEALLRIDSEEFRGISPEVYIPVAEQCGVIREIGLFVFEEVCRFLRDCDYRKLGLEYVDVNLSVYQFLYDDLSLRFEAIREAYGIPRDAINLEITESASMQTPTVEAALEDLRRTGYHFSLDDFGTGYSNLVQLIRTSYKNVKMDKSLLWDADHNENAARLLDNLIRVIRGLGCSVVQEGVETPVHLERCASSGANLIQGYFFSRPIPEQEFLEYLKRGESN